MSKYDRRYVRRAVVGTPYIQADEGWSDVVIEGSDIYTVIGADQVQDLVRMEEARLTAIGWIVRYEPNGTRITEGPDVFVMEWADGTVKLYGNSGSMGVISDLPDDDPDAAAVRRLRGWSATKRAR